MSILPLLLILRDALNTLLTPLCIPVKRLLPGPERHPPGIPVYVMLPLDAALPTPHLPNPILLSALHRLKAAGATGIMADVWWSLCEPHPAIYDFTPYISLFHICRDAGLRVQATMSFHACGGNIGDSVNIPLPDWVVSAGDREQFWFTDEQGRVNREYVSFAADHQPVLPGLDGMRTPVEAYSAFVEMFMDAMVKEAMWGDTVTEVQLGLGPCGELRYPSYPMSRWEFPGVGQLQHFDRYMQAELDRAIAADGMDGTNFAARGSHAGLYNDRPWDSRFWKSGWRTLGGGWFLTWYSGMLLGHAEDVISAVREVMPAGGGVSLAVKVAGIHWWKLSACRAAEATAGYVKAGGRTRYGDVMQVLREHDIVLDFTCLEMRTIDQPFFAARCGPRQLVKEVFRAARRLKVPVAGENALEGFGERAFRQVLRAFRGFEGRREGFTLLRLGEGLLEEGNWRRFERFVKEMEKIA